MDVLFAWTTESTPAPTGGLPESWLGWLLLGGIVGIYMLVMRTRRRAYYDHMKTEADLRRSDPDLRKPDPQPQPEPRTQLSDERGSEDQADDGHDLDDDVHGGP